MLKFSYLVLTFFFLFVFTYIINFNFYNITMKYFSFFTNFVPTYEFGFNVDWGTFIFLIMLFFVRCFVSFYGDLYMEHYNKKKFNLLIILFFSSITLIILSRSFLSLIIGWDLLGLSSICLIIFYPNSTALINSIFTIFFNRLGDICLIVIISFNIYNIFEFYYLVNFPYFFFFY